VSTVIVDTGVANIHSVTSALSRLSTEWSVSDDVSVIEGAERVILPGVGSARAGMAALERKGLVDLLKRYDRPMLGICLGMQLMFEGLGESGGRGLGLLSGDIGKLQTDGRPLPHMGWNRLEDVNDDPLLAGVNEGAHVYFVHSYGAQVGTQSLASSTYGHAFAAVARAGNRMGCQFHPERSGPVGAKILENFLSL